MPDFFQINLEQMLSELRLHESNTQALFNALEGEKAVADYRKRYQNSEPQYEVFVKVTLLLWRKSTYPVPMTAKSFLQHTASCGASIRSTGLKNGAKNM